MNKYVIDDHTVPQQNNADQFSTENISTYAMNLNMIKTGKYIDTKSEITKYIYELRSLVNKC